MFSRKLLSIYFSLFFLLFVGWGIYLYNSTEVHIFEEEIFPTELEKFLINHQNNDGGFSKTTLERMESYYDTFYSYKLKEYFDIPINFPEYTLNGNEVEVKQVTALENLYYLDGATTLELKEVDLEVVKNLFNDYGFVEFENEQQIDISRQLQATNIAQELLRSYNHSYPKVADEKIKSLAEDFYNSDDFVGYLEILINISSEGIKEYLLYNYESEIKSSIEVELNDNSSFLEVLNKFAGLRILNKGINSNEIPKYLEVKGKPGYSIINDETIDSKLTFEVLSLVNDENKFETYNEYIQKYKKENNFYVTFNDSVSEPIFSYMVLEILNTEDNNLKNYLDENKIAFYDNLTNNISECIELTDFECTLIKLSTNKSVENEQLTRVEKEVISQIENGNTLPFYNYLRVMSLNFDEDLKEKLIYYLKKGSLIDKHLMNYLIDKDKNQLLISLEKVEKDILADEISDEPVFFSLYKIYIIRNILD